MPRVQLAHWHGGYAPGEELDVTDEELKALQHDGRIADVLDGPGAQPQPSSTPAVEEPTAGEPEPSEAEPREPAPSGRKRR